MATYPGRFLFNPFIEVAPMGMSEADTRANLIDPVLRDKGWTQEYVKREETARAVEIVNGMPRKRPKGRVDYTLRVRWAR